MLYIICILYTLVYFKLVLCFVLDVLENGELDEGKREVESEGCAKAAVKNEASLSVHCKV